MTGLNLQHLTFGKDGTTLPPEHTVIAGKNGANSKHITVADDGSLNVTIVAGAGSGGTALVDDAAFTVGTTSVTPVAGTYRSTRDSVDDNDAGALAMTAKRGLYTTIETPAGDSAMDEANDALRVNIVAGSSGTQYTEGDTDASITGTAMLWEDAGDTLRAVSAAKPLPVSVTGGGDATAANQTTIIGHLDGVEGLLTTIAGDTTDIETAVELLDDTVATVSATKLLRVGIFDAADTQITSFGGGTQYTEDAAAAANPVGTVLIGVRADALAGVTTTDGDNVAARMTDKGEQYVKHVDAIPVTDNGGVLTVDGTVTVTGVSTLAEQQSQTTHLATIAGDTTSIQTAVELLDDTVATLGTTTYTEATTKGLIMGAVRRDADSTLANTTNEITPLQVDQNGYLKVEIFDGGGTHTVDAPVGTPVFVRLSDGSAAIATLPVSLASVPTHAVTVASGGIASGAVASGAVASGAFASGSIAAGAIAAGATSIATTEDSASAAADHLVKIAAVRLDTPVANANLSNDGDYTQLLVNNFGKLWVAGSVLEDTAHVAGEAIMQNGVRRIDTAATSAGTSGDWATMDASAEGALWSTLTPTTTSGCTIFRSIDLDESEEEIKATAGNVYGYYFYNAAASIRYLKFYNLTAANTTVGTSTPVLTIPVPATTAGHVTFPYAVGFSTAISAAVTTGLADNDTGAPGANDFIINVYYK